MPGHTENEITVNAPVDLVWDITNDLPNWCRRLPVPVDELGARIRPQT